MEYGFNAAQSAIACLVNRGSDAIAAACAEKIVQPARLYSGQALFSNWRCFAFMQFARLCVAVLGIGVSPAEAEQRGDGPAALPETRYRSCPGNQKAVVRRRFHHSGGAASVIGTASQRGERGERFCGPSDRAREIGPRPAGVTLSALCRRGHLDAERDCHGVEAPRAAGRDPGIAGSARLQSRRTESRWGSGQAGFQKKHQVG